ncbi:carbohydrate kinase family protein [Mesorhizobium sp. VNQ89]|uniref:carbohydrate kinase family protein n=1 Tax=Mesorhizobium quangtriensis TaxID=3157709 RepID=UPI0032B7C9FC
MTVPKILAVGGAHIDRRGQMTSPFIPGASIPGTMREDVGGGAFNALRSAVRLGARGAMLSMRGGDGAGETVARAIAEAGIEDLSAVFLDRSTPSYTALLDAAGDVIAALADMQLYEIAFAKQLRRAKVREEVAAGDAILCDANVPAAGLEKLASLAAGKPLFAIAISPAKAVRLAGMLQALTCLYMNSREAAAIAGVDSGAPIADLVEALRGLGLGRGVITHGDRPVTAFDASQTIVVTPPPPRRVADVTGAGDALAGAMTVAILHDRPMDVALREGVAAALLAIETPDAVPDLSQPALRDMLALVPEAVEMPRSKP